MKDEDLIDYEAIGERIRSRRLELNLTQEQLSERVGISSSFVGHLERGEKIPSVSTLYRICASMDISLDYLVLGKKEACDKLACALYADLRKLLSGYTSGYGNWPFVY
ncbi:MAG: helix-turn-helix transcriptional regulator [Clostridia bacterium]|nr:helix-turn-helix transcriptional regulator [Clostridia bacterium]